MSRLDRLIASTFPLYAERRLRARAMTAVYEAARKTRQHRADRESRGPNAAVGDAARSLREQARHLEHNSDIARGALGTMVANVVGAGIKPEPQIRLRNGDLHEELNETLSHLYREWARRPEVTWEFDEPAAQRVAVRSALRDGEVFAQHLVDRIPGLQHGTIVPYSYELIEAEYCPSLYQDVARKIEQGIELNDWSRPVAYHFLKRRINEDFTVRLQISEDTRRMEARFVSHLALKDRIRQVRGVSLFAAALRRISDINEIDETERVAARVAAAMAVSIKKGDPYMYTPPSDPDNDYREIEFVPGMVIDDLQPGEEMQSIVSNRPNNALIPFRQDQFRAMASGLGLSYSSLSRNYNGTYSAQRQELVEQHAHYGIVWSWVVSRLEMPKWHAFLDAAVIGNRDLLRMMSDIDPVSLRDCDFSRPAMPWVDPNKEMAGIEKELALGLTTRSAVMRARGRDPREVARQREMEAAQLGEQPSTNSVQAEEEDDA